MVIKMKNKRENIIVSANLVSQVLNFRVGLIEELKKNSNVYILAAKDSQYAIEELKKIGCKYIEAPLTRRGTNIKNDLLLLKFYIQQFKKIQPKVVLQFTIKPNIYGSIAGKIAKIPTINNVTGLGPSLFEKGITKKLIKILYKVSFKFPKKVFFQNNDDMEFFLKNKLVSKDICGRLPGSGVNIEKFYPMSRKKHSDKIKMLFIGRISENKGVRIVNEVAKKIKKEYPNIEFQLLGKIYEDEVGHISRQEIASWEKESNIIYLGVSRDVREQIREADIIIFPSYYREGVPRSLIEAAAMGKPIITTDNVGCKDIVENGYNGFLAKSCDLDSLLEKIKQILLMDRKEFLQLGINGRLKVEKEFDEKIVIQRYLEAIEN